MTHNTNNVMKPNPAETAELLRSGERLKFGYFTEESDKVSDEQLDSSMKAVLDMYEKEYHLPPLKMEDMIYARGKGYSAIKCYVSISRPS